PANGWYPITADTMSDWDQPIGASPLRPLGAGHALADGGYLLDPSTMEWHPWTLPGGGVPESYVQVDSLGRLHNIRAAANNSLEYRISSDNGQTWSSTIFPISIASDDSILK